MNPIRLPKPTEPIANPNGTVTKVWLDYLRGIADSGSLDALQQAIQAANEAIAELQKAGGLPADAKILGGLSVNVEGILANGVVALSLVNDESTPDPSTAYGTNPDGVKGFYPISSTIDAVSGQTTKTVSTNGVTSIGLADLANSGAGTLQAITRDAKGRISGTRTATTDDLTQGATNKYFVDSPSDGTTYGRRNGEWVGVAGGVGTVTSVGLSAPTGFSVSGSPVTGSGNIALSYSTGYQGYTSAEASKLAGIQSGATAYTDTLARNAAVADVINDGVTNIAPSQNSVFDALEQKQSLIPAGTTGQFYRGDKTFANGLDGDLRLNGVGSALRTDASLNSYISLRDGVVGVTVSSNGGIRFLVSGSLEAFRFQAGAALYSFPGAPFSDSLVSWGSASNRWSVIYASTGAINTSDSREKWDVRELTPIEVNAAVALSREIKLYQWTDSVKRKGADKARWHCGMTVQRAIEVMKEAGIPDPTRYAFICYDAWTELPEIRSETGELMQAYRAAGDRYSFRLDQLNEFIARGLSQRVSQLELRFARSYTTASNGQITVDLPGSGMVLSVTPKTADCVLSGITQSFVNGQAKVTITFKRLRSNTISLLGLVNLSLFESSPGAVQFDLIAIPQS